MNEETGDEIIEGLLQDAKLEETRKKVRIAEAQIEEMGRDTQRKVVSLDGALVEKDGRDFSVIVSVKDGKAIVKYTEISRSHQSFSTLITVQLESNTEGLLTPFSQRIDINSASAITDLRRSLDGAYGKQYNWILVLNRANNAIRAAFVTEQKPTFFMGKSYEENPFLLRPFLQSGASNMVFGDSEVGKTYFCMRMAISLATGEPFIGFNAPTGIRTLFLDYEDSEQAFNNRLFEICAALGRDKDEVSKDIGWYKPEGSMRDIAEVVSRFVTEHRFDLIVIDAGSNAAGGSPNDEQKVVDMFNALEKIPCTKLIIHHEPKNTDGIADNKAYYGTTFWRALTRVAWRLSLENEDDGKLIKAVITKKSNMGKVAPFTYRQHWGASEGNTFSPCYFEQVEMEHKQSGRDKIIDCLVENGELSSSQIREMTGIGTNYFKELSQVMKSEGALVVKGVGRGSVWTLPPNKNNPPKENKVPPISYNGEF